MSKKTIVTLVTVLALLLQAATPNRAHGGWFGQAIAKLILPPRPAPTPKPSNVRPVKPKR
jgi:hypothetical protein